jgi:hypothetical protein
MLLGGGARIGGMAKERDIVELLRAAADEPEDVKRSDMQVLLRKAALDIETLRELVGIRDEVWLETTKPEGNG